MILSLKIAYRFHRSFKRNVFVSLVSFSSIISIIIGISVSIVSLSVINGFKYELSKRVLSIIPHLEITSVEILFSDWKAVLNSIKRMSIVNIIDISPYINFSGVIEFNDKWHLIHIKSINLVENINKNNNKLINFIEKKSWNYFCEHKNQIILGHGASIFLNVKIGDWITILFTHNFNSKNQLLSSVKKIRVQVSGILKLNSQVDNNIAIMSLSDIRNCYYSNKEGIDGIEISVNDVFCINQVIQKIKCELNNNNLKIRSWMDMYGYIYRDIKIVQFLIYLSVGLIMSIACFNVIALLIISVKNKYRDIAILRSLGASNIFIQNIFLWYGLIIYCISSIIGIILGIFVALGLNNFSIKCTDIFSSTVFPKGIYFIDFIPSLLNTLDIYIILSVVFFVGLLISWYASLQANKINLNRILK